jgi:hypothetical protein
MFEPLEPRVMLSVAVGPDERIIPPDGFLRTVNGDSNATISANGNLILFASEHAGVLLPGQNFITNVALYNAASQQFEALDLQDFFFGNDGDVSGDGGVVALETVNDAFEPTVMLYDVASGVVLTDDLLAESAMVEFELISAREPALSSTGRYLTFVGGRVSEPDLIYRYDLQTQELTPVSLTDLGFLPDGQSEQPEISADGRYITFSSEATDLLFNDSPPGFSNIYIYDHQSQTLARVNPDVVEGESSFFNSQPVLSNDGRYVAWQGNSGGFLTVVLADRQGATSIITRNSQSELAFGDSDRISMSADGRYVAYISDAEDLTADDFNGLADLFVYDRLNDTTTRQSRTDNGLQLNEPVFDGELSADGSRLVYYSAATNAVSAEPGLRVPLTLVDRSSGVNTPVPLPTLPETEDDSFLDGINAVSDATQFIVFASAASNLVGQDYGGFEDIFRFERDSGNIERITSGFEGGEADGGSSGASISRNGRYVVFQSFAENLVSDDGNFFPDVFWHDTQNGQTVLVSRRPGFSQSDGDSSRPVVSDDGRYVAFQSNASNLIASDTNSATDVFVRDTVEDLVVRVSVGASNSQLPAGSALGGMSGDGRYVVFTTAVDIDADDLNDVDDVYVRDRQTNQTILISVDPNGDAGNNASRNPRITGDGRYIVFESMATDLVADDTNAVTDIFVYDQIEQTMRLVSRPDGGIGEANGASVDPSISDNGRYVTFYSDATNLDSSGLPGAYIVDLSDESVAFASFIEDGLQVAPDGDFVVYDTYVPLDEQDTNFRSDIYFAPVTEAAGQASVSLQVVSSVLAEGEQTLVRATLSQSTSQSVTVVLGISGSAASGDYTIVSNPIVISANSTIGTATLSALTDGLVEVDESVIIDIISVTNAVESTPQQVTVTITDTTGLPPDVVGSFGDGPGSANPGQTIDVPFLLENIGEGKAVATSNSRITFYLSQNSELDEGDTLVGENRPRPGDLLDPDESRVFTTPITIPSSATAGTYFLFAVIDPFDTLNESDTTNNLAVTPLEVELRFGQGDDGKPINLTITDDDGTIVSLFLTGGGTAQLLPGDGFFDLLISGSTLKSTLKINTRLGAEPGDDGLFTLRNITLGGADPNAAAARTAGVAPAADETATLNKMLAKTTRLVGNLDANSGLKAVQLAEADGAVINIAATGNPADTVTLNFITVKNLTVNSALPVKSLTTARWIDDDDTPDVLSAPWIGSIKIAGNSGLGLAGDFQADITTTAAPASGLGLGSVSIAGTLDAATWTIDGNAKGFKIGTIGDADITVEGAAGSLSTSAWTSGLLDAGSAKTLSVTGNMGANVTLRNANLPRTLNSGKLGAITGGTWSVAGVTGSLSAASLAAGFAGTFGTLSKLAISGNAAGAITAASLPSLTIGGTWTNATVRLTGNTTSAGKIAIGGSVSNLDFRAAGSVTSFTASSIADSLVFLGVKDEVADLPDAADDFQTQATLGTFSLTGAQGNQFSNTNIAAAIINAINLKLVATEGDTDFGVAATQIARLTRTVNGATVTLSDLGAGDSTQDGRLVLRLVE